MRCLASKCIFCLVMSEARCYLDPRQGGVGVPAGAKAIIHSIFESSKWCHQLDFANAFNCISREHIIEEARLHVPSCSAWLECSYGSQPLLFHNNHTISSCSGVQQGDPLGPFAFSLAIQPLVEKIYQEIPNKSVV